MTMEERFSALQAWLTETKDVPLEQMDAFFTARLDNYEEHMQGWAVHYRWMAELLPEGITNLLDLGCGTGLELDAIFQRFPDLHVTGLDLSAAMLQKLHEKHGHRSLTLWQGDYFVHPLGEGAFDCVVSFETLHHFHPEKKLSLFQRICDCLRPGGIYVECDYVAVTDEIEELLHTECERRRVRDHIPPDTFVHFDTPLTTAHEMALLRAAGFSVVEKMHTDTIDDPNTAMLICHK